jgi:type VI secretion system protein ImpE
MDSKDLIKAGRLAEVRKLLTEEVRSSPADLGKRTLLFQVLSFSGEWNKAEQHLDAIVTQDSKRESGVQVYKNLIQGEKERLEVARLSRRPSFFPETPAYTEVYFAAYQKVMEKKIDEAAILMDQLDTQRPLLSGTVNGNSFEGFLDTDTFLSFFLEALVHGRYIWIPFESIRELSVSPPNNLFDLLWVPARIATREGLTLSCYLPVLYPESFVHEDERIKLGRMTDWKSLGGSFSKGMGQHVYQIGDADIPLLEIREVLFSSSEKVEDNEKSD